jgi:phage terminase small subunit
MGVPKRLTDMQMRFAEFIVFGGPEGPMTQSEAAIAAGYSKARSRQEGSELMNPRLSPLVVQYVGSLREERIKKHQITYDTHLAELARLREAALKKNSFSAAVNAETNRGKAGGLYIERKIIKHGKLEDMSEEELENKMKQILDDYAPILNVTPEVKVLDQKPLETKEKKKETKPKNTESNQTSNTHSEEEKTPVQSAPKSSPST